jgi:uncharacterized protein YfaS (alpha-2-macroglobulin family)
MANGLYDPGSTVRLGATFRTQGAFADPTTVTLKVKDPTGTVTTFTHPASLTKDATGRYHRDITPNVPGQWYYRYFATGAVEATIEETFRVRETVIA